jgi:hypothetical protein
MSALVNIRNAVTSKVGRQILTLQKNSPTLLFAAGVAGVVAAAVLASRATLKLEAELDEHQRLMEKIDRAETVEEFTDKDAARARAIVYMATIGRITKLYAPSVAIGIGAICALTGSHMILTRRNLAVTAAYASLEKAFKGYRERVVAEYGEDADERFRFGEFSKEMVLGEDGREVEVKTFKFPPDMSEYARIFDDTCEMWSPIAEYNRIFLEAARNYFQNLLNARGHVFLNEVYDHLGFERSGAGAVVGWLRGEGDSFIDFGLFSRDHQSPQRRLFINGGEPSVLLDFNVCGVIYDKI